MMPSKQIIQIISILVVMEPQGECLTQIQQQLKHCKE